MSAGTFIIPSQFTAIDKFSGPMKNMGNAVAGFVGRSERLLGRANAAFASLMTPLTSINRMLMGLGLYVGLFTLIRIIKNAIDIFANFEQANADLATVMQVTVAQNRALADEARRIGLAYGESATDVVRMQHALATLGFEQEQIMKMGRPLITGAAALEGADPEKLADVVGALINSFRSLEAVDTQHILDVMSLASAKTSLNFEKLATTLPIVSGPANAVNISFERTVALLGVLSNAGVHVATSATSLKNIFIDSAKKGHTYEQVLANIAKNADKLTFANKKFGKRSVVSALALVEKGEGGIKELTDQLINVETGLTEIMAIKRLDTFRGAQKLLNAAYAEFILSIEDGNGALSESLTRMLHVSSAMLLLSSDSDQAREAVAKMSPAILETANKWLGWLKIIGWTTAALIALKIALILWRAVVVIATIAQTAWSVVMGIAAANGWLNVWALRGNIVALGTLKTITVLTTGAQLALNTVMNANPLILMASAVLYLVDSWGKLNEELDKNLAAHKKLASRKGIQFQTGEKSILDRLGLMFVPNYSTEGGVYRFSEDRVSKSWSKEELDSANQIKPIVYNEYQLDSIMDIISGRIKGNINLTVNDPGGHVKDVKSDSSFVMPKRNPTNGGGHWSN